MILYSHFIFHKVVHYYNFYIKFNLTIVICRDRVKVIILNSSWRLRLIDFPTFSILSSLKAVLQYTVHKVRDNSIMLIFIVKQFVEHNCTSNILVYEHKLFFFISGVLGQNYFFRFPLRSPVLQGFSFRIAFITAGA